MLWLETLYNIIQITKIKELNLVLLLAVVDVDVVAVVDVDVGVVVKAVLAVVAVVVAVVAERVSKGFNSLI